MSLLELEPVTGRTHQLRVHLSAIGHPILGDPLYRDPLPLDRAGADALFLRSLRGLSPGDAAELLGHSRLALHALRLEIEHPALGTRLELEAPLPADLAALSAA
jgi:23S rRNA pseudouridine1911/1915/1917 synthase